MFGSSWALADNPKIGARASKDTMNLSFMEPPHGLDFARGPGNRLFNPRVCGVPKAGRHKTALLFVVRDSDAAKARRVARGNPAAVHGAAVFRAGFRCRPAQSPPSA